MKKLFYCSVLALVLLSCGNRRQSPEVLQQKIDSVRTLEALRELRRARHDAETAVVGYVPAEHIEPYGRISYARAEKAVGGGKCV